MDDELAYSQYLKGRSWFGGVYKRHVLYPKLGRYLRGRVLDYGCGIGDFLRFRPDTVGVDVNKHNVVHCVSLGLDAIQIYISEPLPFPNRAFSGGVMDNVLEHIPEELAGGTINELGRVIETGGRLIVGIPGSKGYLSDSDHKTFYSEESLVELFENSGFTPERSFYMPLDLKPLGSYLRSHCLYVVFSRLSD